MKYILTIFFLQYFIIGISNGQAGRVLIFQAKVLDCNTGIAIPFADIFNESQRKGIFTDSSGFFRMRVQAGDTLVIQSFGYFAKVYVIKNPINNLVDTLDLCPQTYDIGEVKMDLPHSYKDFQRQFLEIEPDRGFKIEGVPEPKILDIPLLMDTNYFNSVGVTADGSIALPFSYFYKENRLKRRAFYIERQKRELFIIDKKYNRELIERMTGLKGDSITDFIAFCNFSHQFLYKASELEIVEKIDEKFKEFKVLNNKL